MAETMTVAELRQLLSEWEKKYLDQENCEFLECQIASLDAGKGCYYLSWCNVAHEPTFYAKDEAELRKLLKTPSAEWKEMT